MEDIIKQENLTQVQFGDNVHPSTSLGFIKQYVFDYLSYEENDNPQREIIIDSTT